MHTLRVDIREGGTTEVAAHCPGGSGSSSTTWSPCRRRSLCAPPEARHTWRHHQHHPPIRHTSGMMDPRSNPAHHHYQQMQHQGFVNNAAAACSCWCPRCRRMHQVGRVERTRAVEDRRGGDIRAHAATTHLRGVTLMRLRPRPFAPSLPPVCFYGRVSGLWRCGQYCCHAGNPPQWRSK